MALGNADATTVAHASQGEGVGHQSRSTYYLGSAPAWWLRIVLGSLAGFVVGNLWNRLVGPWLKALQAPQEGCL